MPNRPLLPPTFLEALKLGLNLREACDRADISYDLARQWASKGRKAKAGPVRERYRAIISAQIDFKVSLQAGLLKAVKSGDGKAVERLLSHFEDLAKPTETEDAEIIVTGTKVERLDALARIAVRKHLAADKDGSHVAALGYLREAAEYGSQLDAEKSRITSVADRTPEQVMADETRHAGELEPIHMHVYVREFLRQNRGVHLATDDGPLELCG